MKSGRVWVVVAGVLVAVLLVAVTTGGEVPLAERGPTIPWDLNASEQPVITIPAAGPIGDPGNGSASGWEAPPIVRALLELLLVVGVAAVVLGVAVVLWRHRPRLTWRRTTAHDPFEVREDIASAVVADAAAQRAVLQAGEPRNAIVACWLRLEALVADAGMERRPADTSAEFTMRVLATYTIDPTAIGELSGLFREARFSTHEMDEDARGRAIRALDALHAGLVRYGTSDRDDSDGDDRRAEDLQADSAVRVDGFGTVAPRSTP